MSMTQFINQGDGTLIAVFMLLVILAKVALGDDRFTLQFKLFFWLLIVTIAELVLDLLTMLLVGKPGVRPWLNVIYVFYFTLQPLSTFLWALYANYQVFFNARKLKRLALAFLPLLAANTVLTLLSPMTGWVFRLDASNVYSRGSLFLIATAIPFFYIIFTFVSTMGNWQRLAPRSRFPLLFFAVPPTVGGVVQSLFYGVNLLWPAVALSLLMVYLSIESDLLITDHLTGLHNRRSFDRFLGRKLKHFPADRLCAVVMLDLDGFKLINDQFGHAQGDAALAETAGILRRCLHANDFIARYAGDEFVVVADLRKPQDAVTLCDRIRESFETFNRESGKPWKLAASIGAAVHESGDGKLSANLITEADAMMYLKKAQGIAK